MYLICLFDCNFIQSGQVFFYKQLKYYYYFAFNKYLTGNLIPFNISNNIQLQLGIVANSPKALF
jgi:hypothetical protein